MKTRRTRPPAIHAKPSSEITEAPPLASRTIVWCAALLSLAPFLVSFSRFQDLFFFGDEWDLLAQISDLGLLRWSLLPFAENFVPLFKLLWGGAVLLFNGSYFALILLLWLTHFGIIATFGSILRRIGFRPWAIVCGMLTCALAWSNIESLAWSVQWSPLLATLFFVLSFRLLIRLAGARQWTARVAGEIALYALLLLASALCFSRGVVNGFALAAFVVLGRESPAAPKVKRALLAISLAIPVILMALVYVPAMLSAPHAQGAGSHFGDMFEFGIYALLLNPLLRVAGWDPATQMGVPAAIVFGLFKVAIILAGFAAARKSRVQKAFFGALLLYDFLNCSLLAVGRYSTGMQATVSSRYQYIPLLCLAPFLGAFMQTLLARPAGRLDRIVPAALLLAWCALLFHRWPLEMKSWSSWRGTEVRNAVLSVKGSQPFASSSQDVVHAAQLRVKYNLH